jgi:hypothetical protein
MNKKQRADQSPRAVRLTREEPQPSAFGCRERRRITCAMVSWARLAMRSPLGIPLGLALALAPALARAEPPVAVRLDYARGLGAETCPAEPSGLRAQVAALLGYDPFERSDARERVVVVVSSDKGAWSARVERFNAAGERTYGPETFPDPPLQGDCEALVSPLAAYLRGLVLRGGPPPAAPAPPPPLPPPAPAPPASPPPAPDAPNPARTVASRVAIVSYALAGAFLGLGIGWTVDAHNKGNAALALAAQPSAAGASGCNNGQAPSGYCARLLGAWRSDDKAIELRDGWFSAAGVFGAIGVAATFWALSLPATTKAPTQAQIAVKPGGLVIRGSF